MMNKESKNFFIKKLAEKHPDRMTELNEAYKEMVEAFDTSQDILHNNFIADVDIKHELIGSRETMDNAHKVSYFSDFIFIQQMMTLEIDIILGITSTKLRSGKDTDHENLEANKDRKAIEKEQGEYD